MAVAVKTVPYQIQLSDSEKAENPGSVVVNIPIESLRNVSPPQAGKFLQWNRQGTAIVNADGTGQAPAVPFSVGNDFPGAPAENDLFILTQKSGLSEPGVYIYSGGAWKAVVANLVVPAFPSGNQLPGVASGQFILTQAHGNNQPGLYAAQNNAWVAIASVYDDQAVRALITALTGRVGTLEADNPIINAVIAGNNLTITFKDNTRQDLPLPAGGGDAAPSAPATETVNFGLTTAIQAVRASNTAGQNLAKTAAETAFNNNNANQDNVAAQGLRSSRVANPLASGSYVNFSAPSAPADRFYNAWVAVPSANFSALRVIIASGDSDGDDDTSDWLETDNEVIVNQVSYKLFVKLTEIASDESLACIIQALR